jgi:lipoprotein NlpI
VRRGDCVCSDSYPGSARNRYHGHQSEAAAYFYLGGQALLLGRQAEAKTLFEKSVAIGKKNTDEYQAAVAELHRIGISERPPK